MYLPHVAALAIRPGDEPGGAFARGCYAGAASSNGPL